MLTYLESFNLVIECGKLKCEQLEVHNHLGVRVLTLFHVYGLKRAGFEF